MTRDEHDLIRGVGGGVSIYVLIYPYGDRDKFKNKSIYILIYLEMLIKILDIHIYILLSRWAMSGHLPHIPPHTLTKSTY